MARKGVIAVLVLSLVVAVLFGWAVSKPRVVARGVAPNGIEFCLVQRLGEPFATSAFYRKPRGRWGWFYYDHEDWLWIGGQVELDHQDKTIKVYRAGKLTASFAWETETYTLPRMKRTTAEPEWLPVGKDPWD